LTVEMSRYQRIIMESTGPTDEARAGRHSRPVPAPQTIKRTGAADPDNFWTRPPIGPFQPRPQIEAVSGAEPAHADTAAVPVTEPQLMTQDSEQVPPALVENDSYADRWTQFRVETLAVAQPLAHHPSVPVTPDETHGDAKERTQMFRRKNKQRRIAETIRAELANADLQIRTMLAETVAQIELRLSWDHEARERLESSAEIVIETLRASIAEHNAAVRRMIEALDEAAHTQALLREQIDADRQERQALTEAITALVRLQPPTPLEGRARVMGGTVYATSQRSDDTTTTVLPADRPTRTEIAQTNGSTTPDTHIGAEIVSYPTEPWTNPDDATRTTHRGPQEAPRSKWRGLRHLTRWLIDGT
jgi:hypothetical protein